MSRNQRAIFLITLGALVMALPTAGVRDITTSHEGRVAQTARRMAAAGWPWDAKQITVADVGWHNEPDGSKRLQPDASLPPLHVNPWIVPVLSGEVRLQKPPLPYWVTAVCFKLFGVNEWAARLVPTLMWVLLTLIVADLAAMLIHPRMAIWAAGVWITSYFGFDEFRKCMADPYLAFFAIAAVWAALKGLRIAECGMRNEEKESDAPGRIFQSAIRNPQSALWMFFYILLALGFLSKGPAVFVPVIAGLISILWNRRPRFTRRTLVTHLAGVAIFLLIALPWYAIVMHRVPNALLLWKYESIGGFGEKNEKPQPIWWYLPELLLIALPWTPVWVVGVFESLDRFRRRGMALAWQGLIVVVFSFITQKKNAYLLPSLAAQTLVIVAGLHFLFAAARRRRSIRFVRRSAAGLIATFAVIIAVAFPAFAYFSDNHRSAKQIAGEITRRLPASGAAMNDEVITPEAAFYLPLDLPKAPDAPKQWVLFDNRSNTATSSTRAFAYMFPGHEVQAVKELTVLPGVKRWVLYELTIGP